MGIVYVLTNEAMPGIVKIGRTERDDVAARVGELNGHSAVPVPFTIHFAGQVEDAPFVERSLHEVFSRERRNPKREFFWVEPERVVTALSLANPKDVTPGKEKYLDTASQAEIEAVEKRRPPFKFSMLNISPGSELAFSRNPEIKVIVIDDRSVQFEGKPCSLTDAAYKAFEKMGRRPTYALGGPAFWMHEGKLLSELRNEAELTNE